MSSRRINEFCHYATITELDFLRGLAAQLPAGAQVVMLGAGPGVMAMAVLEGNLQLALSVVDIASTEYAQAHLEGAGLKTERVHFHLGDSAAAGQAWVSTPVQLLIVDANHSYEGVKADMEAWLPHLAAGGYVFFHDYDADGTEFADQERYPGVMQAVAEVMLPDPAYRAWANPGTSMVWQKL